MVAVNNPFLSIVPRKGEKIIGVTDNTVRSLAESVRKGKKILLISGDYGSGKSIITDKIEKGLPEGSKVEKWMFSVDLANQLRQLPMEAVIERKVFVFMDKFELSDVVSDNELIKIIELIVKMAKAGVSFIISLTPKTIIRLFNLNPEFKELSDVHTINPMLYPEVRELIISRLNEVRTEKSTDLKPFTEDEIKNIWKKSRGNPRMTLLILANLYDIKMKG